MQIHTTGANISPEKINGEWYWVVDDFTDDDSYDEEGNVFNPPVRAKTLQELETNLTPQDDERDWENEDEEESEEYCD